MIKTFRTVLYCFKHPGEYEEDRLLKPIFKINTNLMVGEWENMHRIIVSA